MAGDQHQHWEQTYSSHPGMYGDQPSEAAVYASATFRAVGVRDVLELGAGHGRDTLHLARAGFEVTATDFSTVALSQLQAAAVAAAPGVSVRTLEHDAREPIPVPDDAFDGVFAHPNSADVTLTGGVAGSTSPAVSADSVARHLRGTRMAGRWGSG